MPAIGIGVTWLGWAVSLYGYCLVRGYNVKFTDLINPLHPWPGPWPPPQTIPAGDVFPGIAVSGQSGSAPATGIAGTVNAAGAGLSAGLQIGSGGAL